MTTLSIRMETDNQNHIIILNALSEIKSSLSVNTNETRNIKESMNEIKSEVKEVKNKVEFQNGRVRHLEDWSNEAKKLLEGNIHTTDGLRNHKSYLWGAFTILTLLGGVIITLAISAIDSKIEKGITKALKDNVSDIIPNEIQN